MDFKKATEVFADPDFDGDPVQIYEPKPDESPVPPDDIPEDSSRPEETEARQTEVLRRDSQGQA